MGRESTSFIMMKLVLSLLMYTAAAGEVKEWADKYSSLILKLGSSVAQSDPEQMMKVYGMYAALFVQTGVECSGNPYNPLVGFHLKDATFDECVAADEKQNALFGNPTYSNFIIKELIVDEDQGKVCVFLEMT